MSAYSKIIKSFIVLSVVYWLALTLLGVQDDKYYDLFGFLLLLIPILGASLAFITGKEWGGSASHVGKSLNFISLSLFAWALGQASYLYYALVTGDVPFPGLPDYFFVFIDPLYALGMLSVMKYSGASSNLKKSWAHLLLFAIPIGSLYLNYVLFFGDTSYFEVIDSEVIFDLIYSFGSIAIMSLIALTVILSVNKLGGKMRIAIYTIFIGLVLQYLGDIAFSFVELENLRTNGNIADFLFFLSIATVTWGVSKMNTDVFNSNQTTTTPEENVP